MATDDGNQGHEEKRMTTYDRLAPVGPCVSPDGHEWVETQRLCDYVPEAIFCPRCGKPWAVVTFKTDE
jgi:hypothetical protein